PIYPEMTFWKAVRGIYAGATTGFITPKNIGDYVGRIMSLPAGHRLEAITLTFWSRFSQYSPTLIFGAIGFYFMVKTSFPLETIAISIIVLLLTFSFMFYPQFYIKLLGKLTFGQKIIKWLKINQSFQVVNTQLNLQMLILSVFRY